MKHSTIVGIDRIRNVLRYNPLSGGFTWLVATGPRAKIGQVAGSKHPSGHIDISIDSVKYKAHRLAWAYFYGAWPKDMLDHINGARDDNRIDNLRDVPRYINQQNQRRTRKPHTASKLLGVTKHGNNWRARIQLSNTTVQLGTFDTPEAAHEAYVLAKRQLHVGCTI